MFSLPEPGKSAFCLLHAADMHLSSFKYHFPRDIVNIAVHLILPTSKLLPTEAAHLSGLEPWTPARLPDPGTSYLTSLGLSVCIFQMGLLIALTVHNCYEHW